MSCFGPSPFQDVPASVTAWDLLMSRKLAISALLAHPGPALSGSVSLPAGRYSAAGFSVVVQRLWGAQRVMNKWEYMVTAVRSAPVLWNWEEGRLVGRGPSRDQMPSTPCCSWILGRV